MKKIVIYVLFIIIGLGWFAYHQYNKNEINKYKKGKKYIEIGVRYDKFTGRYEASLIQVISSKDHQIKKNAFFNTDLTYVPEINKAAFGLIVNKEFFQEGDPFSGKRWLFEFKIIDNNHKEYERSIRGWAISDANEHMIMINIPEINLDEIEWLKLEITTSNDATKQNFESILYHQETSKVIKEL